MRRTLAMIVMGMFVLMAVSGLFSSVVADLEQNDTFEKAELITDQMQGQMLPGTLNLSLADPQDCYKFNPPAGSNVLMNCSVSPGDKTRYTLFDFNKNQLMNSSFMSPGESWLKSYTIGQQIAVYYIIVDHDQAGATGGSVYQFQIGWPDQNDGDYGGDAGDDKDNPKDVSGKLSFNGTVGDADSADFYSFQCTAGEEIHLTLGVNLGAGLGIMKLYDKDKVEMLRTVPVPVGAEQKIDGAAPHEGTYYLEVYSGEDHKGAGIQYYVNISNVPPPPVDTEPPMVHIDIPADAATLDKTTVIISGTASDNQELDFIEVAVNDGPLQKADGLEAWSHAMVLSVGQNFIMAKATDKAGFCATHEISVNVTGTGNNNDTVAPTLVITAPLDGSSGVSEEIEVKGTASDDKGLLRVEIKVGAAGTWMVVQGLENWHMFVHLINGSNQISVRAVDTAGNTASKHLTVFRLLQGGADATPPNVHFTEPVNISTMRSLTPTVKGIANDDHEVLNVEVSLNGGPYLLAKSTAPAGTPAWSQWSFDALLVIGENILTARAMDTSGNTDFDNLTIIANTSTDDTTPPMIMMLNPSTNNSVTNLTNMVVSGTAADKSGIQRVDVSLNDGPWMPATGTLSWTYMATLANGTNLIKIRVIDKAANVNTTQVTVTFNATADLLKPKLTIESPTDNASVISDKIDVKGTVTDNMKVDRVELTLNGVKMAVTGTTAWKSRLTLKVGKNNITVTAYDGGGNSDTKTITVTYKKPEPKPPIPGFEVGFLLAAVLVGVALLGRKRRA